MPKKKKPITDLEISRLVIKFDSEVLRIFKNLPKCYDYSVKQQTTESLGFMKRMLGKSIKLIPYDNDTWRIKRDWLNDAYSEIGLLTFNLCELNDDGVLSNRTKSYLDIKLAEIELNFLSLLNTFNNKVNGSDGGGCARAAESEVIRTCDYD